MMVFAASYFVGIFAPVMAIWVNAPFYAWSASQTSRPAAHLYADLLVAAVEKTALTHVLGSIAIVGLGYLLARRCSHSRSAKVPWRGSLRWSDCTFGVLVLLAGLFMAFGRETKLQSPIQWLGYTCAAFLSCFVFKSFRLQWSSLETRLPAPSSYLVGKLSGWIAIGGSLIVLVLLLALAKWWGKDRPMEPETGLLVGTSMCLLPWALFRCAAPRQDEATTQRAAVLGACAIRFGFWIGLSFLLALSGLVVSGIATSELAKGNNAATPFALSVVALRPLFCIACLPSLGLWLGGFVIAWLPRTARASERILACGQGGAMASVTQSLLVYVALSLALCTVTSIPVGKPPSLDTQKLLGEGQWLRLSWLYMIALVGMAAGGWLMWASKATIVCALIWARDRWLRRPSSATELISPPIPANTPPSAPSV